MKISAGTIARTIVLAIALINQVLVAFGVNTIPIAEETMTEFITLAITIGAAVVAWWIEVRSNRLRSRLISIRYLVGGAQKVVILYCLTMGRSFSASKRLKS